MSFFRLPLLLLLLGLAGCSHDSIPNLKEGDLLFQTTNSAQSESIQLATHSKYSHVGLVLTLHGSLAVFEAVGPVQYTPIEQWIRSGRGRHYSLKRLKDSTVLTPSALQHIEEQASTMMGKRYDWTFDWSDDKMYCSEAVWKVLSRGANIELCKPAPLRSFDLSSAKVQGVLRARYGNQIPYDEPMVSPEQLYASTLLYTVREQ